MSASPEAINVSVKIRRQATKIRRRQYRLRESISERLIHRFTHNYNEMSEDEIEVHGCMVVGCHRNNTEHNSDGSRRYKNNGYLPSSYVLPSKRNTSLTQGRV